MHFSPPDEMAAPEDRDGVQEPLLPGTTDHERSDDGDRGYGTASVEEPRSERGTFARNLGALEAFGIVVSVVIGSGVFTSPGAIDTNVPSPGLALVVWLLGGVLAWTGASTLAELGTAIPGEGWLLMACRGLAWLGPPLRRFCGLTVNCVGGVQPYLQYIFGDVFGFLAAWTWVVAVMPATLAILSIVFVESIYAAAGVTDQASAPSHKALSVLILILITLANSLSTRASTRLNNFFVVAKFLTITAVAVAGLSIVIIHLADPERDVGGEDWYDRPWFGFRKTAIPDGSETDWTELSQWEMLGHLSAALYAALWAYSGWDKVRGLLACFATCFILLTATLRRRPYTCPPSSPTLSSNSPSPSTRPSRQSSSASSSPTPLTMSCSRGDSWPRQIASQW